MRTPKKKTKKPVKKKRRVKDAKIRRFFMVLGTLLIFALFILNKHGIEQGLGITAIIWSFFVLCTPIATADLLLDVPLRLLTKGRMIYSHAVVWIVAIGINIVALYIAPDVYDANSLLMIMRHILLNPIPYWALIVLCAISTFLSVQAADEVVDKVEEDMKIRRHKHHSTLHYIILGSLIAGALIIYDILLNEIGVQVDIL